MSGTTGVSGTTAARRGCLGVTGIVAAPAPHISSAPATPHSARTLASLPEMSDITLFELVERTSHSGRMPWRARRTTTLYSNERASHGRLTRACHTG